MPRAIWNGIIIAESSTTKLIEGNHYFPPESINRQYLRESTKHTTCPWKGVASYYTLAVNGQQNPDAAWYYPQPSSAAQEITGYVAFWRSVRIEL